MKRCLSCNKQLRFFEELVYNRCYCNECIIKKGEEKNENT